MKIKTINIDNFKGIKSLHKDIKGNVIYVSGKNGSGKTSLLEAIYVALAKTQLPEKAIKEGESKATINLMLAGKDVELEITRTITPKSNSLVIKENGKQVKNCRELLDGLLSKISIDPFKFMDMKEKEQAEIMAKVCGIDFDFEAFDTDMNEAILERQALKRDVKRFEGSRDAIVINDDVPDQEFDIGKLNKNLLEATTYNIEVEAKISRKKEAIVKVNALKIEYNKYLKIAKEEFDEELKDTEDLDNQIKIANEYSAIKADIDRKKQYDEDAKSSIKSLATQEKAITELEKTKDEVMTSFKSPVKGLKTDGKKLYIGDAPYSQASSAERIEVSAKLSMLANKEIKIINIKDGSLLDEKMTKTICKVAADNDCQVFLEIVNNNEEVELTFEEVKTITKAKTMSATEVKKAEKFLKAITPEVLAKVASSKVIEDCEDLGKGFDEATDITDTFVEVEDVEDEFAEDIPAEEYVPDEIDDEEDFFGELDDL